MVKGNEIYDILIKSFSKKTTWIAIVFAILTVILGTVTAETQKSTINIIKEENIFDPICVDEPGFMFGRQTFCEKSSWVEFMGASSNVNLKDRNDNHARVLFMKIDASEIPKPIGPFTTVSISKAELVLKTRYEPAINGTVKQIPFYTLNMMCNNSTWTEKTFDSELPCIDPKSLRPEGDYAVFNSLNPEWIDEISFDIKPHVERAISQKNNVFTELIQFYPVKIANENGFDDEIIKCVQNKSHENLTYPGLDECLNQYRIAVYSNENLSEGVRPQLVLEYSSKPSAITAPLIAIAAAAIPLFSGIIQLQYKAIEDRRSQIESQKRDNLAKMNRICDSLEEEVRDTLLGLKDGVGNSKPKTKIQIEFDSAYEPIELTLDKPVTEVVLITDAYTGILHSGSFENFDKDHQIEISTLYNEVIEYNKTLELYFRSVETARMTMKPDTEIVRFQNNLIMNLKVHLDYLGRLRENIIHRIEKAGNGVVDILKLEKEKYKQ